MGPPKVSVVVPVHNCRATLERTFRSVFDQTLPAEQIEIIAVDDGSTDGSGEELDRLAAGRRRFEVVHQEASGGPGRPRNTGIERATGEYVFFLDADDHLGPEALERCCAMADENGTDVVVPKYVGVGRKVNPLLFRETVGFTTIFDAVPDLYGSITALKLYRRTLLDGNHIRFPENILSGEDQIFAVRAYFEAKGVSVLADYDCYYWVAREDGGSALQVGGAPAALYFPEIKRLMAFVTERTAPGPVRDRLLVRHFSIEVFSRFDPRYKTFPADERHATREAARELVAAYGNAEIMAELSPYMRLLDHALRHGQDDLLDEAAVSHADDPSPTVLDGDRAFLAFPGFRDEALGVPDAVFEVNEPLKVHGTVGAVEWTGDRLTVRGHVNVERIGAGGRDEELVLSERDGTRAYRVPYRHAGDGTTGLGRTDLVAEIDVATVANGRPLPPGRWDAHTVVRVQGHEQKDRLVPTGDALPGPRFAAVRAGSPVITPYLTRGTLALSLHVGGLASGPAPVAPVEVSVTRSGVRLATELATALPESEPPTVRVLLKHRDTEETHATDATAEPAPGRLAVSAEIDLSGARRGKWDVSYEVTVGSATGTFRTAAPADLPPGRKGLQPFRTKKGNLSIEITGAPTRLLRRLRLARS